MTAAAPRLRVEFQNADETGRVRLTTVGTGDDIRAQDMTLADGQAVTSLTRN